MTTIQLVGVIATIVLALVKFFFWWRGKKAAQTNALLKSAEELAKANLRVEQEARRTYEKVESVGPDTPVADGNQLLSGGYVGEKGETSES